MANGQNLVKLISDRRQGTTESSTDTISSRRMEEILEQLKLKTTRSSTKDNYYRIWQSFNKFVVKLDQIPDNWEQRVTLYVAYLIDKGRQSSSVKSYLSAIKKILTFIGYDLSCDQVLLNSLSKACRLQNDKLKIRKPIRTKLLEQLLFELERYFKNQLFLEYLYKAIFVIAYYGLLRIGELTASDHVTKAKDVSIGTNKNKILIVLYTSKTQDIYMHPQKIKISQIGRWERNRFFCPFKIINRYLKLRGPYVHDHDQFFMFRDRSPVKAVHVRNILCLMIKKLGLNSKLFDCHSFRSGHASQLIKLGFTIEKIKRLGRWKSNAVYKYIKL